MKIPGARIVFSEEDKEWVMTQIKKVLDSGQLTLGSYGSEFEQAFAALHRAPYAVATNSGTSSLEIILRALGVEGKEVIVPTNTFFATAAAVIHAGAKPRFADINEETFALSPESILENLTCETAGVIVVHIGGMITPEIELIQQLCRAKGLFLIEDAAHAHGSSWKGQRAGTFGVAGSFSFYPTKIMTSGEGGMIVTHSEQIKNEAAIYRDQGKEKFSSNFHIRLGYNWRMSELHAIVGLAQLRRLGDFIEARTRIARVYDKGLPGITGVKPVLEAPGGRGCYYKYLAVLENGIERTRLKQLLREKHQVGLSGEVYEVPLHQQPVFTRYGTGRFPVSEKLCAQHICLPIYSNMTEREAEYVLESLSETIKELGVSQKVLIGGVK